MKEQGVTAQDNNSAPCGDELRVALAGIVGESQVAMDIETRSLLSHDVFYRSGIIADLVVSPRSTTELAEVVRTACHSGIDIHVRGGGMSYTDAYTPAKAGAVLIDKEKGLCLDSNCKCNSLRQYGSHEQLSSPAPRRTGIHHVRTRSRQ